MSQRIEIPEDYLFTKIGRLVVENDFLHAQLSAQAPSAIVQDDEPIESEPTVVGDR